MACSLSTILIALVLAGQQSGQRSVWELTINRVPHGDVVIVLRGTDVWVPVTALKDAGLDPAGGVEQSLFGETHVLLNSLAPSVTFRLDTDRIRLEITSAPQRFSASSFSILPDRPAGLKYPRDFSVIFNYAAHWETDASGPAVAGEFGVSGYRAVFLTGVVRMPDGRLTRGLSTITVDQRTHRRRWIFGDTFGPATDLGSRPVVLGFSVARDNSIDPYYQVAARPTLTGSAIYPSQAEVYVNGQIVQRLTIPPGPFQVDRLPITTGLGNAEVVVRDPFGREQTFQTFFYLAQGALKRGEQDYSYAGGARRQDLADGSTTYGGLVGTALHRFGVTNSLTLGYQAESEAGLLVAGPVVNLKLWRAGEISWTGLVSDEKGETGHAYNGSYVFTARRISAFGVVSYYDNAFQSIERPLAQGSDWFGRFEIGLPIGRRLHLGLGAFRDRAQQAITPNAIQFPAFGLAQTPTVFSFLGTSTPTAVTALPAGRQGLSLTANLSVNRRLQLSTNGQWLRADALSGMHWEGFAGVVMLFGRNTAQVMYERSGTTSGANVSLDRSLPAGPGVGYRLGTDTAANTGLAEVEAQNTYGYAALRYQRLGNQDTLGADVAGGMAVMGNRFVLSRPLNASYALVRVPGASDVHVFSNNQPVGQTNRWGDLLVPDLFPYIENRLSIADNDLPLDYAIQTASITMAPPYRGGAVVTFPSTRVQIFQGRIVLANGTARISPAYGTLTVAVKGSTVESPLSADGDFYLQNLPPGTYRASVMSAAGSCEFDLAIGKATSLTTSLGTIECQARVR